MLQFKLKLQFIYFGLHSPCHKTRQNKTHTSNQVTPHIVPLLLKKSTGATSISFINLYSIMIPKEVLFTRQLTKPATVSSFLLFCRLLCSRLLVLYDCSRLLLEFSLFLRTISASEYLGSGYFAVDGNLPSETILP